MHFVKDFFGNYVLISAMLGWFIAQFLKIFSGTISTRKFHIKYMFSNGGMPSSHTSTVLSMTTALAIQEGCASPFFAVSAILSVIVMNDAFGVRLETGKQATIINRIVKELFSGDPDKMNTGLKELVGHTPFQVLIGAIVGVIVALTYGWIIGAL